MPKYTETYEDWDEVFEDDYFDLPAKSKSKPKKKRARTVSGVVVRARGHHFDIETEETEQPKRQLLTCQVRGRLLRERTKDSTLVAVGDRVQVVLESKRTGLIDSVEERESALSRQVPGVTRPAEDVIVANPDQALVVFAVQEPEPHLRMLDRFLVIAEANELPVIIVVNKIDLAGLEAARRKFHLYENLGYPLIYTSVVSGQWFVAHETPDHGNDRPQAHRSLGLRDLLIDKLTVVTGPSGVGKSALLNTIHPDLNLRVGELRSFESKGRHTTRNAQLFRLPFGRQTFVADTPGIRELGLYEIDPGSLGFYFVDITPFVNSCRYPNCTHNHEPGCAVRQAVKDGNISAERHDSYLRILCGDDLQLEEW